MLTQLLSGALAQQAGAAQLEAALAHEAAEVPREEIRALAEALERHLGTIPSALDALTQMSKQPRCGRSVAFVAGQVLLYLVDEDDLRADGEAGGLGLLDDAYLIHASVAALRGALPGLAVPATYVAPDAGEIAAVRALLPAGVAEALERTCENLVRVAATLFAGGGGDGPRADAAAPPLRVGDALAALGG
jgi:hypothetical protein